MNHSELRSPVPRDRPKRYVEYRFNVNERKYLSTLSHASEVTVSEALTSRESRRDFGPITPNILSALLWHTAKTNRSRTENGEIVWQSRPTPSAGGVHPIDLLLIDQLGKKPRLWHYDSISHSLGAVAHDRQRVLAKMVRTVNEIVPVGDGTILWFAAQFGRTLAKYNRGESLVWRDAGALLATVYIAAEGLGLNCCGVGVTGDPYLQELACDDRVRGVGGCIIGSRRRRRTVNAEQH